MRNIVWCLGLVVLSVVVAGCATPYQNAGLTGGFSDKKLMADVFQISFNGNGLTSAEKARDFTLLRASEVTLSNGYQFFIILSGQNVMAPHGISRPLEAHPIEPVTTYGKTAIISGTSFYTEGDSGLIKKPFSALIIQSFIEKPSGANTSVYDARQIRDELRKKYSLGS